MPRLIDADAMRQEWLENGENEYVYDTNAVLDSIDAQPTVSRWIPVTERLPEHDDIVIAFFPEMRGTECAIQIQKGWSVKLRFCSHWMPLPEPPADEKEE